MVRVDPAATKLARKIAASKVLTPVMAFMSQSLSAPPVSVERLMVWLALPIELVKSVDRMTPLSEGAIPFAIVRPWL